MPDQSQGPRRKRRAPAINLNQPDWAQSDWLGEHDGGRRQLMPAKPVYQLATDVSASNETPALRLSLGQIWSAQTKPLCWLLYRPAVVSDRAAQRIVAWSYALGYGGAIAVSLYPLAVPLPALHAYQGDHADMSPFVYQSAEHAIALTRRFRLTHAVLATGHLDPAGAQDLYDWLRFYRDKIPTTRFQCLGNTPFGWPAAPAVMGRRALEPPHRLMNWWFPRLAVDPLQGPPLAWAPKGPRQLPPYVPKPQEVLDDAV